MQKQRVAVSFWKDPMENQKGRDGIPLPMTDPWDIYLHLVDFVWYM